MVRQFSILLFLFSAGLSLADEPGKESAATAPESRRVDVVDTLHGVKVADPYRWLEDQNAPETRDWIRRQNEYTSTVIERMPGRKRIENRLRSLMTVDRVSSPTLRGNRYFLSKRSANQDLYSLVMREGEHGKDHVLIDPVALSKEKNKSVNLLDVSLDGSLLLYGVQTGGEDEETVNVYDIAQRKTVTSLPRGRYFGAQFSADHSELFYTLHGEEGSRVYRHSLKHPKSEARLIFGEKYGPGEIIIPDLSHDRRFLILHVHYGSAAEQIDVFYQDLTKHEKPVVLVDDIKATFEGQAIGHELYLQTNWKASNGRILKVNLHHPEKENWQQVVPTSKQSVIRSFSLVGGKLFVNRLENVQSRVSVYEPTGKFLRDLSLPTLGSVSGVRGRWDHPEAFFTFSSFFVPSTIFRYNVNDHTRTIWARDKAPVKIDNFVLRQKWYQSKDGTKVPLFVLHKKELKLDGRNPTILYGYGGFNVALTPRFSARMVTWMELGGVFVVANLRGGGEFGEDWHKAGMVHNKQNVFDDFHAAAEYLIKEKYTSSQHLAISGGSNGGLLVGAALTQRPDLYRAVVCSYPLLDMIRFHQFLVARFWVPEYGSSEDPQQFETLLKYSPYHNVKPGVKYPAVLFITGDADTRVDPLHARKMAALLQQATGSDHPVLLHYDTKLGHSGGRPVSQYVHDLAYELTFLKNELSGKE